MNQGNDEPITLTGLHQRLVSVETQLPTLKQAVSENTAITKQIAADTSVLVEFTNAMQGLGKLVNWCSRMAKPFIYIFGVIGAAASAYFALKNGGAHK
jgi:hypothetical protein